MRFVFRHFPLTGIRPHARALTLTFRGLMKRLPLICSSNRPPSNAAQPPDSQVVPYLLYEDAGGGGLANVSGVGEYHPREGEDAGAGVSRIW
jgi:hypothetical protein